jgi:plastocyanin
MGNQGDVLWRRKPLPTCINWSEERNMPSERVTLAQRSTEKSAEPQTLSALSKTSALALLGNGITCIFEAWLAFTTVGISLMGLLPLLSFALIALIAGVLILRRSRGAQLAGIIIGLFTFAYLLIPATRTGLLQPTTSVSHFGSLVVIFGCALITVVTGIAARMQGQGVQGSAPSTRRWLSSFLSGMGGLAVGMIVIASLIGSMPQSGAAAATTNGMPTVHTVGGRFLTNVVLVSKGESLVLTNDDGEEHIIQNGSWTAQGTPQPQTEPGAPIVNQLDLKAGSQTIGPFTTAGVFHLYCTVHLNMNLTVVVQ